MYYYNHPRFIESDLKTVDRYLLDFARSYTDHAVSAVWIQQFTAFLNRKQDEYIKQHPRVKPVDIDYRFTDFGPGRVGSRKGASIRCGGFSVHLVYIVEEHASFDEPPLL